MNSKYALGAIVVTFLLILGAGAWYISQRQKISSPACTQEAKLCPDGSAVGRTGPNCEFALCSGEKEGISVSLPQRGVKIKSPLKIEGMARGQWFFEAQFSAVLLDSRGDKLGTSILTAKSDWMTESLVPFDGELNFIQPTTSSGTLRFLSDNPSGLEEYQKVFEVPVGFESVPYRKILLYYYNPEKDRDSSGNTKCSRDGLMAIERDIPISKTPIQDTINLLLKGKENLTEKEIKSGITTEYPLEGLKLSEANFKNDGTLVLKFDDPFSKTSGGSCRAGILWFQIEAAAKQFPGVKKVGFLPEELFQP